MNYPLLLSVLLLFGAADTSMAQSVAGKRGSVSPSKEDVSSTTADIGNQRWMGEDLNVDKFRNGDPIPEAKTNEEWEAAGNAGTPAWCYYKNDASRARKHGKLYNWYAVSDARGIAPAGFHVPTAEEWEKLVSHLGGDLMAGDKLRGIDNSSGATGFKAIPGSCRYSFGSFNEDIGSSYWWSGTASGTGALGYRIDSKGKMSNEVYMAGDGLSVRCVKD